MIRRFTLLRWNVIHFSILIEIINILVTACLSSFVNHKKKKTELRNQREVSVQQSCAVTAGPLPQWADEDRRIWRFKVLFYHKRMLKTASLLSTDQLSQQHGQWSCLFFAGHPFVSFTKTHTRPPLLQSPTVLNRFFCGVPETDSLIWFTLPPSVPSCLDSHLLCYFPDEGKRRGVRGTDGDLQRERMCGYVFANL